MSKFNKCKHCGNKNPEQWVGRSTSLCGICADIQNKKRPVVKTSTARPIRRVRANAGLMAAMAIAATSWSAFVGARRHR